MKFKKGDKVCILPLDQPAVVLHAFCAREYAKPNAPRYTVRTARGIVHECEESELD